MKLRSNLPTYGDIYLVYKSRTVEKSPSLFKKLLQRYHGLRTYLNKQVISERYLKNFMYRRFLKMKKMNSKRRKTFFTTIFDPGREMAINQTEFRGDNRTLFSNSELSIDGQELCSQWRVSEHNVQTPVDAQSEISPVHPYSTESQSHFGHQTCLINATALLNPVVLLNKCDKISSNTLQLPYSDSSLLDPVEKDTSTIAGDCISTSVHSTTKQLECDHSIVIKQSTVQLPCTQSKQEKLDNVTETRFKIISEWKPYQPKLKLIKLKRKERTESLSENHEDSSIFNTKDMSSDKGCSSEDMLKVLDNSLQLATRNGNTSFPVATNSVIKSKHSNEKCGNTKTNIPSNVSGLLPGPEVNSVNILSVDAQDIKPSPEDLFEYTEMLPINKLDVDMPSSEMSNVTSEDVVVINQHQQDSINQSNIYHSRTSVSPPIWDGTGVTLKRNQDTTVKLNNNIITLSPTQNTDDWTNFIDLTYINGLPSTFKTRTFCPASAWAGLPTYGSIYSTSKLEVIQHLKKHKNNYIPAMLKILMPKYPRLRGLFSNLPISDKRVTKVFSNILKKAKRLEHSSCRLGKKKFLRTVFNLKMNLDTSSWKPTHTIEDDSATNTALNVQNPSTANGQLPSVVCTSESMSNYLIHVNSQTSDIPDAASRSHIIKQELSSVPESIVPQPDQDVLLLTQSDSEAYLSKHLQNLKAKYASALALLTKKNKLISELEKKLELLNNKQKKYKTKIKKYRREVIELDTFLMKQSLQPKDIE